MKQIGTLSGKTISWSDPQSDGGRGTGEVMVGMDSTLSEMGTARTRDEAMQIAQRFIDKYESRK